jgi:imidazole glycerol-phosphate synthase subunit HisH
MKRTVIIDYDMGNLFSVKQACENAGIEVLVSSKPDDILNCDALILPGVGAFHEAMQHLKDYALIEPIKQVVNQNIPLMGICLGMQLLFTQSEEYEVCNGLNFIKGEVLKFPEQHAGKTTKIPQINWNTISINQDPLLEGIKENEYMYFVHSYYVDNKEEDTIITKTNYAGIRYCSGVRKKNIVAFQFHPEKSANQGLKIYNNFKKSIYGS